MNFEDVLSCIKNGDTARRESWEYAGKNVFLVPGARRGNQTRLPYIVQRLGSGRLVPWLPSFEDLFAEDWMVIRFKRERWLRSDPHP